ncbi:MAG: hypothetical protein ACR2P1_07130 [Pseudomonadales bacterium]
MRHDLFVLLFALLAPLTLTGGFHCYYSDSDSDIDRIIIDDDNELIVIVSSRKQQQTPIEGLEVVFSDSESQTDSNGRVVVPRNSNSDFYIGDIFLGSTSINDGLVGVEQIVGREADDSIVPVNVLRLLLSLDRFRSDTRITIPTAVNRTASLQNPQTAVYIEALDFADTEAFENAATNLLALLTVDYPFTTELVAVEAAEDEF